jgi:beta-lactamase class A
LAALPPIEKFNRSYSNSARGLQALLDDLAKEKGNFAIAVHELSGQGRSLSANGNKAFEAASTYKMFVAYSVLKRIENGQMHWSDTVASGRDAAQCFDDMIIKSDNPCAEEWGKRIGWTTIQNEMRALGLTSTKLGTTFYSTASDQALFLNKLEKGESLKGESRDRLLAAMKRQQYRAGIPAGVGVDVADKVGFLNGLLHDSAIVYSPKGTYVLVILRDGSSWGNIADAARQINTLLNS